MSKRKIAKDIIESLESKYEKYYKYVPDLNDKLKEFNLGLETDDDTKMFVYRGSLIDIFIENRCRPYDGFSEFFKNFIDIMEALNNDVNFSKSNVESLFNYFKERFKFETV